MICRRDLIKLIAALPIAAGFSQIGLSADRLIETNQGILRKIPSSDELIPVIGMGSYQTFNVVNAEQKENLLQVLQAFFAAGGSVVDSSPMYGRSESVLGELIDRLPQELRLFAASKVWTFGEQAGIDAIKETQRRMRVDKMDLLQVHNLRDWQVQLATLNRLKQENKLRYTGITTSRLGQFDDFEAVMQKQKLDFVQLNYNIKVREAEKRLLPLAQDRGQAVIVNMPFEKGRLFKFVKGKPLPDWADEIDCASWGQFFLKFIISHPAVTCVIPATSKVKHMKDNMAAGLGRLPDQKMRLQMLQYFEAL